MDGDGGLPLIRRSSGIINSRLVKENSISRVALATLTRRGMTLSEVKAPRRLRTAPGQDSDRPGRLSACSQFLVLSLLKMGFYHP